MLSSRAAALINLALVVAAWSAPGIALADCTNSSNHYVRSNLALLEHQEIHRANMQVLGIKLAWENSHRYAATFPYLLDWLALHDAKKQKYIDLLCQIYGTDTHLLPYDDKVRVEIRKMNDEEELDKISYLKKMGLVDSAGNPISESAKKIITLLRELEDVADKVERLANPISGEELGKLAIEHGKPESKMDADYTFKFVAPKASEDQRKILRKEYDDMLAFYRSQLSEFTDYASALGTENMARRNYYLSRAKGRVKDYARLIKGAVSLDPKMTWEGQQRTNETKGFCLRANLSKAIAAP